MTTRARASHATGIEVGASSGPEGQRADRRARSVPVGRMPLAAGASMNPAAVLALQRLGGNRAVTSMLAGQAAPEESPAGSVDERLEREADGAASQSAPAAAEVPPPPETPTSARPGKPLQPEVRTAAERHFGLELHMCPDP